MMNVVTEGAIYDACKRVNPRVFLNCHALPCFRGAFGVVLQTQTKFHRDEGQAANLISTALSIHPTLQWVIVVDEDVDIFSTDDVLWALVTRVNPKEDIVIHLGTRMGEIMPGFGRKGLQPRMGFDATTKVDDKWIMRRGAFEPTQLTRWLTQEEVNKWISLIESDYARSLIKRWV
jgi:4-hydroxy-3-polyprenylbenzoate decarboxylase